MFSRVTIYFLKTKKIEKIIEHVIQKSLDQQYYQIQYVQQAYGIQKVKRKINQGQRPKKQNPVKYSTNLTGQELESLPSEIFSKLNFMGQGKQK